MLVKPTTAKIVFLTILGLTTFVSAFLLFSVQPLISKYILPWFGGNQAVWITAMVFFQIALVFGYSYAFVLNRYLKPARQVLVHSVILLGTLLLLPIIPSDTWQEARDSYPAIRILLLLAATVGLPYILLSSTAPLTQAWAGAWGVAYPYKFYALSNTASLLALISFPILIEPVLPGSDQAAWWSYLYGLFAALVIATAAFFFKANKPRPGNPAPTPEAPADEPIPKLRQIWWVILAAAGTSLLVATTAAMSEDIAPVPFLWIMPLAIYLLTFILSFGKVNWYRLAPLGYAFFTFAFLAVLVTMALGRLPLREQILTFSLVLFAGCMICHGELVRSKPETKKLTAFYLLIAIGGAIGGLVTGILPPLIFSSIMELYVSIAAVAAITIFALFKNHRPDRRFAFWKDYDAVLVITFVVFLAFLAYLPFYERSGEKTILRSRNFYGAITITEDGEGQNLHYSLSNGRILHGNQFLDPGKRLTPTTYYGQRSGIGILFKILAEKPNRKIGVVGLGTGTIAAFGKAGDMIRFYEIDPQIIEIARRYFTYLRDSPAQSEVSLGDARLVLENEPAQNFDVLTIDAFSGDAIPVHLLTREALGVYLKHLKSDGVLAMHISNSHLDLLPIVYKLAEYYKLEKIDILSGVYQEDAQIPSNWVLLSQNRELLSHPDLQAVTNRNPVDTAAADLWTDDYSNLWRILR